MTADITLYNQRVRLSSIFFAKKGVRLRGAGRLFNEPMRRDVPFRGAIG